MSIHRILFGLMFVGLWLVAPRAVAQEVEAPNYKEIRSTIQNAKGPNYYPTLMRRYLENDTTLTLEQYRNLYYGFSLQDDFVPYQAIRQDLYTMRSNLVSSRGSAHHCPEAIRVAQTALDDNPFDLLAISTMAFAYLQLKDSLKFQLWDAKQNGLLDAIVSSGDGETPETAFHVINLEHEYEVLNRLGLKIEADSLVNDRVEYLRVKENAEDIPGIFFNFSATRSVYRRKYE